MADKFITAMQEQRKQKPELRIFSPSGKPQEKDSFPSKVQHSKDEPAECIGRYGSRSFTKRVEQRWFKSDQKATKPPHEISPTTWEEIHNAYCAEERGHKAEDCIGLRQEVVRMLNQGYLRELLSEKGKVDFARGREQPQGSPKPTSPACTINMIVRGGDDSAINHVKFTTTHKLKRTIAHERYNDLEDSITFDRSDADGLSFPHYDALVITFRIVDTDVKRIMVDDRSGTCIIHPRVLVQMRLEDKIIPCCITLIGFNNAVEQTSGEIADFCGRSHVRDHLSRDEPRNSLQRHHRTPLDTFHASSPLEFLPSDQIPHPLGSI
uniref:Uncharacterized protein n=1 Tax=Nicotiana tabacum TaxID=4097 RepID=A0A1S3X834_TOBAC|nr:PREDICTED: uncharacterized protein LOC107762096 [Nicotiana tabacum]